MSRGQVEATGRTKAQDKAGQEQEPQRARLIGQDVQDVAHEARQGSCQDRHLEAVLCPDAVACTAQKGLVRDYPTVLSLTQSLRAGRPERYWTEQA